MYLRGLQNDMIQNDRTILTKKGWGRESDGDFFLTPEWHMINFTQMYETLRFSDEVDEAVMIQIELLIQKVLALFVLFKYRSEMMFLGSFSVLLATCWCRCIPQFLDTRIPLEFSIGPQGIL